MQVTFCNSEPTFMTPTAKWHTGSRKTIKAPGIQLANTDLLGNWCIRTRDSDL